MNLKKILLTVGIGAALFAGGCAKKPQKAAPVLTKTEVLEKAQQPFKSGQAKQVINLKTATSSQVITSTYTFGGNPTVFHLNYQSQADSKSSTIEEWLSNTDKAYINGQSSWYVDSLPQMTGHTYADLLAAIMANEMLQDPPQKLIDAYHYRRSGTSYTLTATLTDPKIMRAAVKPVFQTNNQSPKQLKVYRELAKEGKYQKMDVKLVVKKRKLAAFNYQVHLRIGKLMTLEVGQSYANLNSHDFLKVPTDALNAKPLPKSKK